MLSEDPKDMAGEIQAAETHATKHYAPIAQMVQQFATQWYRDDMTAEPTPENHVFAWNAWMHPQLAFAAPAAIVEANWEKSHNSIAQWMEAAGKRWAGCYPLHQEFSLWVRDALFAFGVLKIGLEQVNGQMRPFLKHVPMDQFLLDPRKVDHISRVQFCAHRYDVDMDNLQNMRDVDPAAVAVAKDTYQQGGEKNGIGVSGGATGPRKAVRCYDVWFPETQRIGTLLGSGPNEATNVWLRPPRAWWGPKNGPFRVLGFKNVPGDPYPCSDLQPVMNQIQTLNAHLRADAIEAAGFKTILAVDGSMPEAGKAIEESKSNAIVYISGLAARPNAIQMITLGGVHPQRLQHTEAMKERVQRFLAMGDAQQGISNNDTATSNQIAATAANVRVKGMQATVNREAALAMADVLWYQFYDPSVESKISFTAPVQDPQSGQMVQQQQEAYMTGGTGEDTGGMWYRGEFFPPQTDIAWPEDFTITIDPESTSHTNNVDQQNAALLILQQVLPQAYQMLQTMPGADVEYAVNLVGESMNRKNLFRSLFSPQMVAMARAAQPLAPMMMPANASPAMGPGILSAQGGLGGPALIPRQGGIPGQFGGGGGAPAMPAPAMPAPMGQAVGQPAGGGGLGGVIQSRGPGGFSMMRKVPA